MATIIVRRNPQNAVTPTTVTTFSADFTTLGLGPQATLPGGLALQRASTKSVQVSATQVYIGAPNDTAVIGRNTNDENSHGLSFDHAATNVAYPSTPPAASAGVWAFVPGTGTATANNGLSPNGITDATLYAVANNSSYIGQLLAVATPAAASWSFWYEKQTATSSLSLVYSLDTTKQLTTYDTTWRRSVAYAAPASSLFFDQRVANANPPMNTFLWGVQVEAGKIATELIPTTTAAATRAGERLYLAVGAVAFPNGIGQLNFEFRPKGNAADYAYPVRLLSDPNDATTYVEITSAQRLNIVIHGASWSPTTILNWTKDTDVKVYVTMGGVCSASYSAGGGAVSLGKSPTAIGLVTPSGAVDFLCNGTTQQLASRVQRIEGYIPLTSPGWLVQPITSRQSHNIVCDGDSLTFGYGITNTSVNGYPGQLGNLLGATYGVTNVGVSGQTLGGAAGLIATAPTVVDPLLGSAAKRILIIWAGTNDIEFLGGTGASVWALLQTYIAARYVAGWDKIIVKTMLPRDLTNPNEATRQAYNTLIRSGLGTIYDRLSDVGANALIGANGTQNNIIYYNAADQTHLTQAGQAVGAALDQAQVLSLG